MFLVTNKLENSKHKYKKPNYVPKPDLDSQTSPFTKCPRSVFIFKIHGNLGKLKWSVACLCPKNISKHPDCQRTKYLFSSRFWRTNLNLDFPMLVNLVNLNWLVYCTWLNRFKRNIKVKVGLSC